MSAESVPTAPIGASPVESDPRSDEDLVRAVLGGATEAFEELVRRHQPRLFATARRYARRESEVEDIVQEVFLKAFERLPGFRFEAPFDHWLMRVAVRTCYDFLRAHQRTRESAFTDLSDEEEEWLNRFRADPDQADEKADAARALVQRLMETLPPQFRLVIQLLEIEERSIKEIHQLTGWSMPLIKVRAFRARAAMRRALARLKPGKYL
ncbi:MAG: sigma-70 family RNA polymerase sigma factor [Verrucomicrobiales bacterium]|nr:sigma-70 family RNA polymerase sigma factor [Verrucomicrobiales bacterium]